MKAPFIYFGGKQRVAHIVWRALGDVDNYIEPFAGSLAVLLDRPKTYRGYTSTINDKDAFLSNFWRALAAAPEEVAKWSDWPVNEADLMARHLWLVNEGAEILKQLEGDPDFYDSKVAGWWVWGINSWIGAGWCSGKGCWRRNGSIVTSDRQRPHLGSAGQGVNRQRPHLGSAGQGVNRQRPHLGSAGQGDGILPINDSLYSYFRQLARILRKVRVCCGDWRRVVTEGAMTHGDTIGIFLDPPYLGEVRQKDLYTTDDHTISKKVRKWAIRNGENPRLRIVLAGYETEHKMPDSWTVYKYSARASYQSHKADGANQANRRLERLWFSPHCLPIKTQPKGLGLGIL